jgi:two-component system response regulator EvgA
VSDRVLIVMDDSFELSTISAALKLHGVNVIGEARKASTAISLMRSMQPNVLLIDMHLTKEHSIEVANLIRKEIPDIGIVVLVSCPDFRISGEKNSQIPLGARIVIKKSIIDVSSLCEVISESKEFDAGSQAIWVNGNISLHERTLHSLMKQLTDIQIETWRLVANGLTNAEISRLRFVSEKSVEQVVSRIAQVLNVYPDKGKNLRVQLVNEYFRSIGAPTH